MVDNKVLWVSRAQTSIIIIPLNEGGLIVHVMQTLYNFQVLGDAARVSNRS
jgi:hypothetical protein